MKFEETTGKMNEDRTVTFVKLVDRENAQSTTLSLKDLKYIGDLANVLSKLGYETVTITVEDDQPILVGKKDIGILVAPRIDD